MSLAEYETREEVEGLVLAELLRFYLSDEVLVPAPGAGLEWSKQADAGEFWELRTVTAQLVTSAVVANRSVKLRVLDNNGNEVWRISPVAVQAAAATVVYTWLPGLGYSSSVDGQQIGIHAGPLILRPGWTIGSLTTAIDVGDVYSKVVISTRRWSPQRVALALDWVDLRPRRAR